MKLISRFYNRATRIDMPDSQERILVSDANNICPLLRLTIGAYLFILI